MQHRQATRRSRRLVDRLINGQGQTQSTRPRLKQLNVGCNDPTRAPRRLRERHDEIRTDARRLAHRDDEGSRVQHSS
jgi:hypothetical protein